MTAHQSPDGAGDSVYSEFPHRTQGDPSPILHFQASPASSKYGLLHSSVGLLLSENVPLGIKPCFGAVWLGSSPVLSISQAPSSATQLLARTLPRKALPALGVSTLLCPSPPLQGILGGEGASFCGPCGPALCRARFGGGAARGSRTHLAAAVPPRCRNPGRPRPSGGSPPASQPGTGGSAQHPGGALPCGAWGGQEGGLIRGHGVRHGERTLCCGPFWTWGSHTRSSPRPHVSKPDPEAPATHPSGFGRVREDFAGPEPAWAFSNRRAAISSEQKDAHCSCRAPRSWRRSLSW